MSGINKVILIGRLGRDPEKRALPSGGSVCSFSLAVSETWQDKSGEKKSRTEWMNIVAFGKLADLCATFLRKGKQAYVEGRLQTREYETKQGVKAHVTEVNAQVVQFLSGGEPRSHEILEGPADHGVSADGDLPF